MRVALLSLVGAASAALSTMALASQPATQPANGPSPAANPATTAKPATPPPVAAPGDPIPVPVPDLPVISSQELEGGLIIQELKIGDGYEVKPGGAVVAFYHGTLKDTGTEFDSAFKRGEPAAFPLSNVIEGWRRGVPGMKVGGIRRLIVPSAMGYGSAGAGDDIPPNSDLVFVIQLVDALQVEDVKVGTGDEAKGQFVAVTAFTMKDQEGKEVAKADAANPYIWIPNELQGVQVGLEGMKVGGKRKLTIPAALNSSPKVLANGRPQNVPVSVEIELIAVRNLPGRQR